MKAKTHRKTTKPTSALPVQITPADEIPASLKQFAGKNPDDAIKETISCLCKNCLHKDPELRLKLVEWADFDFKSAASDDAVSIRKRISLVQLGRSAAPAEIGLDSEVRVKVATITARLGSLIRKECVSSGLFPPITLRLCLKHQTVVPPTRYSHRPRNWIQWFRPSIIPEKRQPTIARKVSYPTSFI